MRSPVDPGAAPERAPEREGPQRRAPGVVREGGRAQPPAARSWASVPWMVCGAAAEAT